MHNIYLQRITKLQSILKEKKVDAILISNFYNILYLTGFKTLVPEEREAFVLVTQHSIYLFTDGRYVDEKLKSCVANIKAEFRLLVAGKGLTYHLKEILKKEKFSRIAFEEEDLKYYEYTLLKEALELSFLPLSKLILQFREIKDEQEIQLISKGSEYTDQCLKELIPIIKVGMTEKEFAWKLEVWIREHGYALGFDPIVAVNKNAAIPHYDTKTGNGVFTNSSVILIDMGIRYQNYNSDITRMVFLGKQSAEVHTVYESLKIAQQKTLDSIQKDQNLEDIDFTCREFLKQQGQPNFMHSTGHGVGLEVHESPRVSMKSKDALKPHQVITIEPGIYLENRYGMRVEDTIYIDENYKPKLLTHFSKNFLELSA